MILPDSPERFSKLLYPVHKSKAKLPGEFFNEFPSLKRYFGAVPTVHEGKTGELFLRGRTVTPIFEKPDSWVKVIKYIIYVFDPDSDLNDDFPDDYKVLKEAALKEAGFRRLSDGEWPEDIIPVLEFKDVFVNQMILDYLKVRNNETFKEMRFLQEELEEIYRIRATDFERASKLKLDESAKSKREELALLKKQFFAEHREFRKVAEELLFPINAENAFKTLEFPEDVYKVKQTKDVPTHTRFDQEED